MGCIIVWDDVIAAVRDEGDSPHVAFKISPSSDDGFPIEVDFAAVHVEPHVAACIREN